jgi:hypothetical protein
VNTHEDRIWKTIPNFGPTRKGDEIVTTASHNRAETLSLKLFLNTNGGIESEPLFVDFPIATSIVTPTMTGVDHHRVEGSSRCLKYEN